jgi:hypothetical protein
MVVFISGPGDKRGHGKTPLFMAGMKCHPLCKVISISTIKDIKRQKELQI